VVWWPAVPRPGGLAVVWVHGTGGGIDFRPDTLVCRGLAARGHFVVKGNNRGHDMGAALRRRAGDDVLGGGWWEQIGDSALDVAAWIDLAAGLGQGRVVLLGKSYGTTKALWYQAVR
jgi:pimeloyl-ACP methyl ester carboxylesterase